MCTSGRHTNDDHGLSRRSVLRFGLAGVGIGLLGPWTRDVFSGPVASGPRLVVLNLRGGNDGLNTVVPAHLSTYFDRRPTLALASSGGTPTLSLASGPFANSSWRLHPALTRVRARWNAGHLAVVHKVGYPDPNGSHFQSETIYSRARRDVSASSGPLASGWIARLADEIAPTPVGAISIGTSRPEDFRGAATSLLSLPGALSKFEFEVDNPYANTNDPYRKGFVQALLAQFQGDATTTKIRDTLEQGHVLEAAIQSAEANYTSSVVYPVDNALATHLQSVAKLVQFGVGTKVFYVATGGYDTHGAQPPVQATLHQRMDAALGAFIDDLEAMGEWSNTILVVISEFGRRNYENGSAGTDHGAGNTTLVFGGAIQGGMFGEEPVEADLLPDDLQYKVDFRSIYQEIVAGHLGASGSQVAAIFPEPLEITTTLGIV